ncbi:hypothetical protein PAXRUDRAFT_35560 [Paxillus rubicundulus Ve08.2h10]|uniref:Uncharacterized protein n=1 Tax=Paxillus rubicundulus Ve08.2h10 TaxID=930991 RepID=A0A0D0CII6_9AGAM|nr:hypothetical protein PAXRUDRAFT_35560 [Paxillus rubicundulus Ve08.2h10]
MSNRTRRYVWVIIGGSEPGIYQDWYGHWVFKTLQTIVNTLPPSCSYDALLTAFGSLPEVQTLIQDDDGFYAVVIGAPPGVHQTLECVMCAEGTFKYHIKMHTTSFLEVLAFLVVKGIDSWMLALLTLTDILGPDPINELADMVHHSLSIDAHKATLTGPIIYTHIHNLCSIISSQYVHAPDLFLQVQTRAQLLGKLATHYLAAHGYSVLDINIFIHNHRQSATEELFVMQLTGDGVSLVEATFLLLMMNLQEKI